MNLPESEIVTLGTYCESLLSQEHFNTLVRYFEIDAFSLFQNTKPEDHKAREAIYAEYNGVRSFVSELTEYVVRKNEIIAKYEPSDDDAHEQGIDY